MLERTNPRTFAQELRQVARQVAPNQTILVLEGGGDRLALSRRLGPDVVVRVAGGRETLLIAYDEVEEYLKSQMVFVSDCDGNLDPRYKGLPDLVISVNRDLEADLVFVLDALPELLLSYLPAMQSQGQMLARAGELAEQIVEVSLAMGLVLSVARSIGKTTQVRVPGIGKRTVSAGNLGAAFDWGSGAPTLRALVGECESVLGWGMDDAEKILQQANAVSAAPCGRHNVSGCAPCLRASMVMGHQIVYATQDLLKRLLGVSVRHEEVANLLHARVAHASFEDWGVRIRLDRWASSAGLEMWRN